MRTFWRWIRSLFRRRRYVVGIDYGYDGDETCVVRGFVDRNGVLWITSETFTPRERCKTNRS
jgi:hypothetical protein